MGTYDIGGSNANNLYFKNCVESNFFSSPGVPDASTWGIMGTNYCKNFTYDHSRLSRLDAHAGVWNASIINGSEVNTVSLIGGGTALIKDSTIYGNTLITLRSDYGSTWKGDVIIDNVLLYNTSNTVYILSASWYNHYFGYVTHLPETVTINNLRTKRSGTTSVYIVSSVVSGGIGGFCTSILLP